MHNKEENSNIIFMDFFRDFSLTLLDIKLFQTFSNRG